MPILTNSNFAFFLLLSDLEAYVSPILYAKYEKVDIEDLIKEHYSHLNNTQQDQLKEVLF